MKKKEMRSIKEDYRSEDKCDFLVNKRSLDENIKIEPEKNNS